MKKILTFSSAIILSLLILSCDSTDPENEDNNKLGGDTNIALGEVGNTGSTVVEVNGQYTTLDGFEIMKNDNGIVEIKVSADISNVLGLADTPEIVSSIIYPLFLDEDGKLNTNLKYKITSEGIQDFNNVDGKAHTLVKYDCKVGDKYTLDLSNGTKLVRTVTAKSTQDDFQWGYLNIKTITIEQNAIEPGVSKHVFRANHRFGIVYAETVMEDGSSVGMYVYPNSY